MILSPYKNSPSKWASRKKKLLSDCRGGEGVFFEVDGRQTTDDGKARMAKMIIPHSKEYGHH
jgi:hypothetical protein